MELYLILVITIAILIETTILTVKKVRPAKSGRRKIYVDTSALIDGRILNVAKSGFLDGDLIILKSVLLELQLLADGKDAEKRNRARAGLSLANELERVQNINTEIVDDGNPYKKVDEILLKLAKENRGVILTLDYNLIKVAEAEKIPTLNIQELSLALRDEFLPGEKIMLKITERGSNKGQGIGHLPNGTMVVVDRAAGQVGKEILVEFVRFLETPAGRLIFAKKTK